MTFRLRFPALILAAPAGAVLKPDPGCKKPQVPCKRSNPREPVAYTLEKHPQFKSVGRLLGLF